MNLEEKLKIEDEILDIKGASAFLKTSEGRIYYEVFKKRIPHMKFGKSLRFSKKALMTWLKSKEIGEWMAMKVSKSMYYKILHLVDAKASGSGHLGHCPAHNDKNPSLSLKLTRDGNLLIHCFSGCTHLEVLTALNIKKWANY